jgi:hypothetical protein
MKNLLFALMLLVTSVTYGQTYYAVQVMSTENPHLIKKDMVVKDTCDVPMIDLVAVNNRMRSRILYVFNNKSEQLVNHAEWLKIYPDALLVTMTEKQVKALRKLFDNVQ